VNHEIKKTKTEKGRAISFVRISFVFPPIPFVTNTQHLKLLSLHEPPSSSKEKGRKEKEKRRKRRNRLSSSSLSPKRDGEKIMFVEKRHHRDDDRLSA
jgi:hypothetical protein